MGVSSKNNNSKDLGKNRGKTLDQNDKNRNIRNGNSDNNDR